MKTSQKIETAALTGPWASALETALDLSSEVTKFATVDDYVVSQKHTPWHVYAWLCDQGTATGLMLLTRCQRISFRIRVCTGMLNLEFKGWVGKGLFKSENFTIDKDGSVRAFSGLA